MSSLFSRLSHAIWDPSLATLPSWKAGLIKGARIVAALIRDFLTGTLSLRATSLVYTTLLSLVPLLAFAFSVVKALGVKNIIAPLLHDLFAPLGPQGDEVATRIVGFVENMQVGVLGSVGLLFLIYTTVSLIGQIEDTFNFIWRVEQPRSWSQRFAKYVSVLLVGPMLMVTATGITASIGSTELVTWLLEIRLFSDIAYVFGQLVPYLLMAIAFTFIYALLPNTRVRFSAALTGALVAALFWQLAGTAFTGLVVGSAKYAAIYSSFAILIAFLIWLYIGWLILLLGATVSFYYQYPQYLLASYRPLRESPRVREKLALAVLYLIAFHHRRGRQPWDIEGLALHLDAPREAVVHVVDVLERKGLLLPTGGHPVRFVPSRALDTIPVIEALRAVREAGEQEGIGMDRLRPVAAVDDLMSQIDRAVGRALDQVTFEDLCDEDGRVQRAAAQSITA